jgi:LIVCS family branched-chain amino acid:cation transporter
MDLIAALFFSTSIWMMVQLQAGPNPCHRMTFRSSMAASLLASSFLAIVYIGLCFAAAGWREELTGLPGNQLMTHLALLSLGSTWGILANIAIALACLTTVVGLGGTISMLSTQFAPWIRGSQHTRTNLIIITSMLVAPLGFSVIAAFIHPIIALCYPAIIVLAACNILYKLYGWHIVRRPFWIALAVTVLVQLGTS